MRPAAETTGQIMPPPRPKPAASPRNPIPDSRTSFRASPRNRRSLEYSATPPGFLRSTPHSADWAPRSKSAGSPFRTGIEGRDRKAAPHRRVPRDARQAFAGWMPSCFDGWLCRFPRRRRALALDRKGENHANRFRRTPNFLAQGPSSHFRARQARAAGQGELLLDSARDFRAPPRALGLRGLRDQHVLAPGMEGMLAVTRASADVAVPVQDQEVPAFRVARGTDACRRLSAPKGSLHPANRRRRVDAAFPKGDRGGVPHPRDNGGTTWARVARRSQEDQFAQRSREVSRFPRWPALRACPLFQKVHRRSREMQADGGPLTRISEREPVCASRQSKRQSKITIVTSRMFELTNQRIQ